jgi:hypothetical protein
MRELLLLMESWESVTKGFCGKSKHAFKSLRRSSISRLCLSLESLELGPIPISGYHPNVRAVNVRYQSANLLKKFISRPMQLQSASVVQLEIALRHVAPERWVVHSPLASGWMKGYDEDVLGPIEEAPAPVGLFRFWGPFYPQWNRARVIL